MKHPATIDAVVNQSAFAKLLGVSRSTVNAWVAAGMPCKRDGQPGVHLEIALALALPWVAQRRDRPMPNKLAESVERTERLRLANQRTRRETIETSAAMNHIMLITSGFVRALDSLPLRVTTDDATRKRIATECEVIRTGLVHWLETECMQ